MKLPLNAYCLQNIKRFIVRYITLYLSCTCLCLPTTYGQARSNLSDQQSSREKHQGKGSFLSVEGLVLYTPKWLLKADLLRFHHRGATQRYKKATTYDGELHQALFFPCSFMKLEQHEQAPIFFSAHSVKLNQSHILLQEPSLHVGTFKLSLPSLSMQTPYDDLGYFKVAWQNQSPWFETGIKILPWTPRISIIPTVIYSQDTLGFGTHLKHYHQSLRTQLLAKQTVSNLKLWYLKAKGGNAIYTLRGTWFSHFREAQVASTERRHNFSLPISPLIYSDVWQDPYAYVDGKLMLYDHARFQSYLKYQQSRVMSHMVTSPVDERSSQNQALHQQQSLLYSHHYKDDYYSNKFDRFHISYLSLNVQAQQGVGIYHLPNDLRSNNLLYNETLLFQTPNLIHTHAISLRPSLYSDIGQSSLWAFVNYEGTQDLHHKDLGLKQSQTYSRLSRQLGFEHALKLSAKYYKSSLSSKPKPLSQPKLLAKPNPVSASQVYLHQVHFAPRLTLRFDNYLDNLDQLDAIDQVEQTTRYGLLLKQSLSHSSYQLLLNHWLYSEQATSAQQSIYQEWKLATLSRLSGRQLLIDYIHDPQRYRRVLFSISSPEKTYKSHRFSAYLNFVTHQFLGRFFENRSTMANQDFITLSERILFLGQRRVNSFSLTQQSLNVEEQRTQSTGQASAEKQETLGQPFTQNLSQLSLGLSFDAFSLDISMILTHPNVSGFIPYHQQLFTQQTVLTWQSPCRCWHIKLSGLYTPLATYDETSSNLNMWAFSLSAGLGEAKANVGFTPNFALDSVSH